MTFALPVHGRDYQNHAGDETRAAHLLENLENSCAFKRKRKEDLSPPRVSKGRWLKREWGAANEGTGSISDGMSHFSKTCSIPNLTYDFPNYDVEKKRKTKVELLFVVPFVVPFVVIWYDIMIEPSCRESNTKQTGKILDFPFRIMLNSLLLSETSF